MTTVLGQRLLRREDAAILSGESKYVDDLNIPGALWMAVVRSPIAREDRSLMNVTFWLKDEKLDDAFVQGARQHGIVGIKGHRSVGGMRASLYNAMSIEGVQALVRYMGDFEKSHG